MGKAYLLASTKSDNSSKVNEVVYAPLKAATVLHLVMIYYCSERFVYFIPCMIAPSCAQTLSRWIQVQSLNAEIELI